VFLNSVNLEEENFSLSAGITDVEYSSVLKRGFMLYAFFLITSYFHTSCYFGTVITMRSVTCMSL
jgi:hypothetical protein